MRGGPASAESVNDGLRRTDPGPGGSGSGGRRRSRRRWALVPVAVWLPAVAVLLPLLVVVWRAMQPAGEAWSMTVDHRLPEYVKSSVLLALAVVAVAVSLGVPAAWYVAVYEFRGRRVLEWALLLPLTMPGYIAAVAYVDVLEGMVPVYVWIRKTWGIEAFRTSQVVAPWVFSTLVLGLTLFPYVYLPCRAAFARQATGVLEAARLLGAGPGRVFRAVALPLARPAVAAGGALVAFETLNDYGTVSRFGLSTLTPGIYRSWGEGDVVGAMRLALVLVALAMSGLLLERWQRGRRRYAAEAADAVLPRRRPGVAGLVRIGLFCWLPLVPGFLLPAWRLARWAWHSWDGMPDGQWRECLTAAGHTFSLSIGTALLATGAALMIAGGRRAARGASAAVAERAAGMGYAFPGALVAVGTGALVSSLAAMDFPGAAHLALSASVTGLIFACFVRFLAVAVSPVSAGFARVAGGLHDAARTMGAGPLRTLLRIDIPLVLPAVTAGAALVFLDVFKELTMTLVLRPFDYETLATRTFRLADEGRIPEAAVPALILVAFSLAGLIPLTWLMRRATR